jgi:hypothetical protein
MEALVVQASVRQQDCRTCLLSTVDFVPPLEGRRWAETLLPGRSACFNGWSLKGINPISSLGQGTAGAKH